MAAAGPLPFRDLCIAIVALQAAAAAAASAPTINIIRNTVAAETACITMAFYLYLETMTGILYIRL